MGTICIFLGLIVLVAFTGAGFFFSNSILSNQMYMSLLKIESATEVYTMVVGVCAFVGLLICLSLVMSGLIYNRSCKNADLLKKMYRH